MEEAYVLKLKEKIIGGVIALTTRTLFLQLVSFVSTLILTILLSPSVFGVFFIVSALISFLTYFSDIGLAAALIQKKGEPTSLELSTVFFIQQSLVILVVLTGFLITPLFNNFYRIGTEGIFLFQAFLISFFLSSLKTIPSVLLERKLEFNLLIIPQIIETVIFYLVAIILAWQGAGINSFSCAVIARAITGTIAIYIIRPWQITFRISFFSAKHLLKFGIPFQLNSILALIKDDLMTIFLGKILPFSAIGYIGWAKKWAEMPLRLIMDSIIRVTFPTFSRLQENSKVLAKALEKAVFFLALFIFPIIILLSLSINHLIYLLPKYQKWQPAVTSFYLFAFASIWASFSSPIVNALNAIGQVKTTLKLMVIWTILTWILVPVLVSLIGYNGVALAAFIISFTSILPILIIRRLIAFRFLSKLSKPLLFSLLMSLPIILVRSYLNNLFTLVLILLLGIIIYLILVLIFLKNDVLPYLPQLFKRER